MKPDQEQQVICPACRFSSDTEPFFQLPSVPVQSVRLISDPQLARAFPRGSLALFECPRCGLVFNRDFEPGSQHWDPDYEESQACSGHFNQFAIELAEQLTDRYQLEDKRILEAGCGKGHFLALLCRDGRNTGLGVDPAFDPARLGDAAAGVTYRQEVLRPAHLEFEPDLVVCRHTLEHIADPGSILGIIAGRSACDVFLEVPDLGRILDEGAFWDIYYEHCCYFDSVSLAAAMQRSGIECLETALCFHAQYLLAWGRTGTAKSEPGAVSRAPVDGASLRHSLDAWRRQLRHWQAGGESVVLWGGGSKAVAFLSGVGELAAAVEVVVDINPRKQGHYLPGSGHAVLSPEALADSPPDHIVIMNPVYRAEITAQLSALRIHARLVDVNRLSAAAPVP